MNRKTQQEIQKTIQKLKKLPLELQTKQLKKVLRKNAKPLVRKAKSNIPKALKEVHRYKDGKIVETHKPGNLRKAIGILSLRRTAAVYVGPRAGAKYKNNGWYGHFLELGTVFQKGINYMENAYKTTQYTVINGITKDVKTVLNQYLRKNRIR